MIQGKSVLAIIPARIGSKRLPKKNIRPLSGKPLITWTIESALASKYIDECIVSTDSNDISNVAIDSGAKVPFLRPSNLAKDDTSSSAVYLHALESIGEKFDIAIFLQPTSPLRLPKDIDKSLELMLKSEAPSVVSLVEIEDPINWYSTVNKKDQTFRTLNKLITNDNQYFSNSLFKFNGAIKAIFVDNFLKSKAFFSESTVSYVMPELRSIDIDNELDFVIAEFLINQRES